VFLLANAYFVEIVYESFSRKNIQVEGYWMDEILIPYSAVYSVRFTWWITR
jgi:hypothetical protein